MKLEKLIKLLELKEERRTGWQIQKVERPESVAAHSWSAAFLTVMYAPDDIDFEKAVSMALVHDIEQAEMGDIPNRPDTEIESHQEELDSVQEVIGTKPELLEIWREKQEMESAEAVFVEDMEQIDMVLQALKYSKQGRHGESGSMEEFFESADRRVQTEVGRRLFKKIRKDFDEHKRL